MIDLLFGALMLFAFEMGNPNVQEVFSHKIDLPDEDRSGSQKSEEVLPLVPVRLNDTTWIYETGDRKKLTADQVAQQVKKTKSTPVLLLTKTVSVQSYLDAETPLRKLGLKVGLAVTPGEGKSK